MRALMGIVLLIPLFVNLGFAPASSAAPGSITRNAFTEGTTGELAVLPGAHIVVHQPLSKETDLYAKGAFAVDSLTPGTYQIEANAPGWYAALSVGLCADASSPLPAGMNMAAASSAASSEARQLRAMDRAFSRKVHHHA